MSSDQPRRRESSGSPGSPMGSTAAIIIAIVAVVAGFLILRQIGDDDNDSTVSPTTNPPTASTIPSATVPAATDSTTTTTTIFTPVTEGATIVVANASTVDRAAGTLTTALAGKGFTLAPAMNASTKQDASTVLYDAADPEALAVANSLAVLMGGIEVLELPAPPPVSDGSLPDGVSVLVMLGSDKAAQTLDAMGSPTTLPPTTLPGATTPPGDTTASTG
jgi:LytR cell envelope-related transcriptional attenuator